MTNEEIVAMLQLGDGDRTQLLTTLYQQNYPFILKIANKFRGYAEIEDLTQEAYFGLCAAADHWQPTGGATFMTYAANWLKMVMTRYATSNSTIRVPEYMAGKIKAVDQAKKDFQAEFLREPEPRELAAIMGITMLQLEEIRKAEIMAHCASLDSPVGEDDSTLADMVQDQSDPMEEVIEKRQREELKETIWKEVDSLPERQSKILRMRYQNNFTLQQCADRMGCSVERARQNELKAIRELRKPKHRKMLSPYLANRIAVESMKYGSYSRFMHTGFSSTEHAAMQILELERLKGMEPAGSRREAICDSFLA